MRLRGGVLILLVLACLILAAHQSEAAKRWQRSAIPVAIKAMDSIAPKPPVAVATTPEAQTSISPSSPVLHPQPEKHAASVHSSKHAIRDGPCVDVNDCTPNLCQTAQCIDNICNYTENSCPLPQDPCAVSGQCLIGSGLCVYDILDCDDFNNCTVDACEFNVTEGMPQCKNDPIPDCSPDCVHRVNITIDIYDTLNVTSHFDGTLLEFCQTTNYLGPGTAVVLGFDPYSPCNLNERGSCDNRFGFADTASPHCVFDPVLTAPPCNGTDVGYSFNIQGIGAFMQWNHTIQPASFLVQFYETGRLTGYISDPGNPDLYLYVDLWFTDLLLPGNVPPGSPILGDLDEECYNVTVNPTNWLYYTDLYGTIKAVEGTAYEGLIINVALYGPAPQFGAGANTKNSNDGVYAQFTWSIVSQANDTLLNVSAPEAFSQLFFDYSGTMCAHNNTYCSLFEEPSYDGANGWVATLNEDETRVMYCANFTINDLLHCNSFNETDTLFNYTNQGECENCTIDYYGTLYETTVIPNNCTYWPDVCGELEVRSSCYNISLHLQAGGIAEVRFSVGTLEFDVQWIANIWLCGVDAGNLQMIIRTRINQNSDPFAALCNPEVDLDTETGYPISFVAPLSPPCVVVGDYCYQEWILRTFDAINIVDFSGYKLLKWDVCTNATVIGHVEANLDLHARHTGDQSHMDGRVTGELDLYRQADFDTPYNGEILTDCDRLYGSICLTNHQHLDIVTNKVMICFSAIRNLPAFDPLQPYTTGCSSPGADVVRILLYSDDPVEAASINNAIHDFYFVNHPDMTSECEFFSFKALAYSAPWEQILRVVWCAQEEFGNGGMVEYISEFHMDDGHHHYEHHDDHSFSVECPHDWFFDFHLHHCIGDHGGHGGVECTDDDDCDEHIHHGHSHHHHRHRDDDDDDDGFGDDETSIGAWILLIAIVGLSIIACVVLAQKSAITNSTPPPPSSPSIYYGGQEYGGYPQFDPSETYQAYPDLVLGEMTPSGKAPTSKQQ